MKNHYLLLSILNIISKILTKLRLPGAKLYNTKFHTCIMEKLRPYFCSAYRYVLINNENEGSNKLIIWIFWWQGVNNAPNIVRKCINSIIDHVHGCKVVLITKKNVKKYATISKNIYNKLFDGEISLTHFSDILRFNLLDNYGGLWLDSTIYCTSEIYIHDKLFTCGNNFDKYNFFVSNSRWTGFIIGGCKHNPLFVFMDEFFSLYWENNTALINYFLIDYALNYAYINNIGGFKTYVNNKACKNDPHLYTLVNLLNDPYSVKIYQKITNDTNLFKLTYKKHFKDDGKTFYSKLINN